MNGESRSSGNRGSSSGGGGARDSKKKSLWQSPMVQYGVVAAMCVSLVLFIVIPWATGDGIEPPSTSVLFLGDSQCENMKQIFADTLHEELTLNLKMRGLLQKGGVRMKMDCRSWRRIAECTPVHKHCSNAKEIIPRYCKDKRYDTVVTFLGVNNIDWNSTIYGTPGDHYEQRMYRTIQEVDEMVATAATACPGSRILTVSPMNIAKCGWGWGHLGDTCRSVDGQSRHPYALSHWLGDQFARAADNFPTVTFYNSSGLEDTSKYYDATHSEDPDVAKNVAMGISNAIAVQMHAQQMTTAYSLQWRDALTYANVMFPRKEIVKYSSDPASSINIAQGRLDYRKPKLTDAFHEPTWEVLCGNNTALNETITGTATNATGDGDSEAACGKIELKDFWSIVGILLVPLFVFELLAYFTIGNISETDASGKAGGSGGAVDPLPKMMPALEGIRVLGALHICVFHLYQRFEWTNYNAETCQFCGFGKYWVQVFFMLTGFVSYKSCSRESGPDGFMLARRRVAGLYPLYFIACVMGYLVTLLHSNAASADEVFRTLLLNQTWWPPFHYGGLSGPGWFLSNLLVFWVGLPHWARAVKKASFPKLICLIAVSYLASWGPHLSCYNILDFPLRGRWYVLAVHNLIEFSPYANWYHITFGLGLAALIERWAVDKVKSLLRLCGASVSMMGIMVFFLLARSPGFTMGTHELLVDKGPLALPVLAILMLACTGDTDPMAKYFLTPLGRAASLSWPIYILHVPVSQLLKEILEEEDFPVIFNVFVQPCVILLSACLGARFHTNWNAMFANMKKKKLGSSGKGGTGASGGGNAGTGSAKSRAPTPVEIEVEVREAANGRVPMVEEISTGTRTPSPELEMHRKASDDQTRALVQPLSKRSDEYSPKNSHVLDVSSSSPPLASVSEPAYASEMPSSTTK